MTRSLLRHEGRRLADQPISRISGTMQVDTRSDKYSSGEYNGADCWHERRYPDQGRLWAALQLLLVYIENLAAEILGNVHIVGDAITCICNSGGHTVCRRSGFYLVSPLPRLFPRIHK